ncbi:hypothetical protein, partial [Lactobacillus kefiranofaciens]|uniref:hypothetical protein n=1 Tax=Lactobacillus kefiranofaciens TaxID=267818 RepID=UPI001C40A81E
LYFIYILFIFKAINVILILLFTFNESRSTMILKENYLDTFPLKTNLKNSQKSIIKVSFFDF